MERVRPLIVKALIEGLTLHVIEREPTHGYGILKELGDALGERPSKNQVYPLLHDLEEEGYIDAEEVEDPRTKQVYRLTEKGQGRLADYRGLPRPFKDLLAGLFGLPHLKSPEDGQADVEQPPAAPEAEPEEAPDLREELRGREDWVPRFIAELPGDAPVRAPFARVSVDRAPQQGVWTLTVENHEPSRYEGAEQCPLTFLYLAMQKLLFERQLD